MSVSTDTAPEVARPRSHPEAPSPAKADALFDLFFGGGVGGSAIALFFLVADAVGREVLFTPSAMGTALFTGQAVSATTPVQNDMVVFYSLVHFAVFGGVALAMSLLTRRVPELDRRPLTIAGIVFAVLTVGILAGELLVLDGVVAAIGLVPMLAANAVTGVAMAVFFRWSHLKMR